MCNEYRIDEHQQLAADNSTKTTSTSDFLISEKKKEKQMN